MKMLVSIQSTFSSRGRDFISFSDDVYGSGSSIQAPSMAPSGVVVSPRMQNHRGVSPPDTKSCLVSSLLSILGYSRLSGDKSRTPLINVDSLKCK